MNAGAGTPGGLVADANVLIDYAESGRIVLAAISRHLAPLYIPSPVLDDEVSALSGEQAGALGCTVVEPTLDQLMEAAVERGPLSYYDWLCLIVARDAGLAVLTNDKPLRRACRNSSVPLVWGLEAMVLLSRANRLSPVRALKVAERMSSKNPYITKTLLARFRSELGL